MKNPKPIKPGQPITADFLNRLRRDETSSGWGSGRTTGSNLEPPRVQLFKAQEDFAEYEDVYRGLCKDLWYDRDNDVYAARGEDLHVYSRVVGVSENDIIAAFFNSQSGRWEGLNTSSADGTVVTGGGGFCPCVSHITGSVDDVTGSSLEWCQRYIINFKSIRIGEVEVVYQGSDVWNRTGIEVSCDNEDESIDVYSVTMTVTDNGDTVTVVAEMTSGGGDGGIPACCGSFAEDNTSGFQWTFKTHFPPDPLNTFKVFPDPSGTNGRPCGVPACELCVIPQDTQVCGNALYAEMTNASNINLTSTNGSGSKTITANTYVMNDSVDNLGTVGGSWNEFCDIDSSLDITGSDACSRIFEYDMSEAGIDAVVTVTIDGDIIFSASQGNASCRYIHKGYGELPLEGQEYTLSKCRLTRSTGPDTIVVVIFAED